MEYKDQANARWHRHAVPREERETLRKICCAPYYFGRYSPEFERHARDKFCARIIRGRCENLGSVLKAIYSSASLFVIGGDCFTALPVIFRHESMIQRVYWIDAHGDYNSEATTSTGFLGGMALAALTGQACERLPTLLGHQPISPTRCTHVGGRAWDPLEKERMRAKGINLLHSPPSHIPPNSHVHIDVDAFDLAQVRDVTHPSPGGMSVGCLDGFLARNAHAIASLTVSAWRVDAEPPAVLAQLFNQWSSGARFPN